MCITNIVGVLISYVVYMITCRFHNVILYITMYRVNNYSIY